jgi:hypothetical protein
VATKRGRPPKPTAEKKTAHAGVRLAAPLYERLVAAAAANRRTLSQEIEARLRASFEEDKKFGGPTNYWVLRIIAHQILTLERLAHPEDPRDREPRRWWQDPFTFRQVKILIDTVFDCFKPNGRAITPHSHARIDKPLGERLALREIANVEAASMEGTPLDGYPEHTQGLPPGTLTSPWPRAGQWFAAAGPLVIKLKRSPLAELYNIERIKK